MSHDQFATHCAELLSGAGAVRRRRMFGGHGLYVDGLFVAIIAFDRLYLKADGDSAPRFEAAGGERFIYAGQGKAVALNYWTPPADAMESPALMQPWVRLALQAALRAPRATRTPRRPSPR